MGVRGISRNALYALRHPECAVLKAMTDGGIKPPRRAITTQTCRLYQLSRDADETPALMTSCRIHQRDEPLVL